MDKVDARSNTGRLINNTMLLMSDHMRTKVIFVLFLREREREREREYVAA